MQNKWEIEERTMFVLKLEHYELLANIHLCRYDQKCIWVEEEKMLSSH